MAHLFAPMGVDTGLSLPALLALRSHVGHWFDGEPLHGSIARAGPPKTMKEAA